MAAPLSCAALPGKVGAAAPGGVSCSLDTCDQVRKNTREKYKQALVDALDGCGRVGESLAVKACGEDFKVGKCLGCGAAPAFPISCDNRLCPDCAARRGAILVSEHEDMLKRLRYPKMLTLTFLSVAHLDKGYIKWARNCFMKLRRRKIFRSCWGGIYSFEATHSVKCGWHLHIHALIGSGYIDQGDLSGEWEEIAGAKVVWIESVYAWAKRKAEEKGLSGAAAKKFIKAAKWDGVREVVKYPCKAATFLGDPALVDEFLTATQGVNLAYGFGAMYRVKTRRHGEGRMRCPICGGSRISFNAWDPKQHGWGSEAGYGFIVPRIGVEKVKGGYIWRSPPGGIS